MEHRLVVRTEVLDQIEKALMQALSSNTKRRRRMTQGTRASKDAAYERQLLTEGLQDITKAQEESWAEET